MDSLLTQKLDDIVGELIGELVENNLMCFETFPFPEECYFIPSPTHNCNHCFHSQKWKKSVGVIKCCRCQEMINYSKNIQCTTPVQLLCSEILSE